MIGDGEAETGAARGHRGRASGSSNPARDGAVLPILHLNEHKISGPTVLGRASDERDQRAARAATATTPLFVEGDDPARGAPRTSPRRSTRCLRARSARSRTRRAARRRPRGGRRWPAIVLRTPKGWTGPKEVDGVPVEGTFRAHQVPLAQRAREPRAPGDARGLDAQLPTGGALRRPTAGSAPELAALAPRRRAADGREPARQRRPAAASRSTLPDYADYAIEVRAPGRPSVPSRPGRSASCCATSIARNATEAELPPLLPRRDELQPARRRLRGRGPLPAWTRAPDDDHVSPGGPGDGGALRAQLPGLARGLPADRSPRAVRHLRGVRDGLGLDGDPAREVAGGGARAAVARAGRLAERAAHLDLLAQRPQRLQPPGPGADRHDDLAERQRRPRLPAARRQHACSRSPTTACEAATTST